MENLEKHLSPDLWYATLKDHIIQCLHSNLNPNYTGDMIKPASLVCIGYATTLAMKLRRWSPHPPEINHGDGFVDIVWRHGVGSCKYLLVSIKNQKDASGRPIFGIYGEQNIGSQKNNITIQYKQEIEKYKWLDDKYGENKELDVAYPSADYIMKVCDIDT